MFRLDTPGGGGYGFKQTYDRNFKSTEVKNLQQFAKGSLYNYEQIQSSA